MQPNYIKAFRQRLIRAGFDVQYIFMCGSVWDVYVIDPCGKRICRSMTKEEIEATPREVWFE